MAESGSVIILFFVLSITIYYNDADNVLCDEAYCNNYKYDPGCPNVSPQCFYNNATHSGALQTSATICNCCEFCFVYLPEGAECSLGGLGGAVLMTSRCGPGLSCQTSSAQELATCRRMKTNCHAEQDEWDKRRLDGSLGALELRPHCDGSGDYGSTRCVPGKTCFCQDKNGDRIFGEAVYADSSVESRMTCACSDLHHEMSSRITAVTRWPAIGARCLSDGNFNPLQCIKEVCFCVDTFTGRSVHHTATNTTDHPNLAEIDCFDGRIHFHNFTYKMPCEEERDNRLLELQQFERDGYTVVASSIQDCDPDGTYSSIRNVDNRLICVDIEGMPIDDYGADINTVEGDIINCRCARTRRLMFVTNPNLEQPFCCRNGNYRPIQCRRGVCYCVNHDGIQVGHEVDDINLSSLSCYTAGWRNC